MLFKSLFKIEDSKARILSPMKRIRPKNHEASRLIQDQIRIGICSVENCFWKHKLWILSPSMVRIVHPEGLAAIHDRKVVALLRRLHGRINYAHRSKVLYNSGKAEKGVQNP